MAAPCTGAALAGHTFPGNVTKISNGTFNVHQDGIQEKDAGGRGELGRSLIVFGTHNKDHRADDNQAFRNSPDSFNLQTDETFSAGTVVMQVHKYKPPREEEREGNADSNNNQEKFFL
jgi:hypothetical protein